MECVDATSLELGDALAEVEGRRWPAIEMVA
jgi:hypothetical protein